MTNLEAVAAVVAAIETDRAKVEAMVEIIIALLDLCDGDPDREDGDEDCCRAGEDLGTFGSPIAPGAQVQYALGRPGDPEDAEEDDDLEPDHRIGSGPAPFDIVPARQVGARDQRLGGRTLRGCEHDREVGAEAPPAARGRARPKPPADSPPGEKAEAGIADIRAMRETRRQNSS